jgi:hypothetical protein
MKINFRQFVRRLLNTLLGMFGLELTRRDQRHENYLNLKKILADAEAAGLSLGEYIDAAFNEPGATDWTLEKMAELGVFSQKVNRVCEIGPGSGRYLERTITFCHPQIYEIYETAKEWRRWLAIKYSVIAHEADGETLSQTSSHSVDLVQAHKVFVGLKVFEIMHYFLEMIRVCAPGGYVVFDVLTENCFQMDMLGQWLDVNPYWPCALLLQSVVTAFFLCRGMELIGRFTIPMRPGITDYFVFRNHKSI